MDGEELTAFAARDALEWAAAPGDRRRPAPTVRDGWVAYRPLSGGEEADSPLADVRVIDEVAVGSVLVLRLSWRPDHGSREYVFPIDMSDVPAGAVDGAAVRVLDRLLALIGDDDWNHRRVLALSDHVALVVVP